jgi:predicted ATPase
MDRITCVRIRNVRAIEKLDLEVSRPFTVLIGENGAGKSTVLECLELLRKASEPNFLQQFYAQHRGMPGLLRAGATEMKLGIRLEDDSGAEPAVEYYFVLESRGTGATIRAERFGSISTEQVVEELDRDRPQSGLVGFPRQALFEFGLRGPDRMQERVQQMLRGIEVHVGFDTWASWAARTYQRVETLRGTTTLFPAPRLSLLAGNLVNAWAELRNRESHHWAHTLALVRLGLGDRVDTVLVNLDQGGGSGSLALHFTDLPVPIPAANLSDGQLSWLAFVAMARLNSGRSLLAIDEPELHIHPALLTRVCSLLADLEGGEPVVVGTHSDRFLDLVKDPVSALRACHLEGNRAIFSRIDPSEIQPWLEKFGGELGQFRASGYLPRVLVPTNEKIDE